MIASEFNFCDKCFNARIDPDEELTDNNDFSSSTIEYNKHDNFRMMLSSGAGKPLRIEAEQWNSSVERWVTVGQYYPKYCPECGREITEYKTGTKLEKKKSEKKPKYIDVKCPFFKKWTSTSITCEGVSLFSRCVSQTFSDSETKDYFVKHNCCIFNPKCQIFAINSKM